MAYYSDRLVHVVTRADLATLLTPTYAATQSVDDEEAHGRLTQALTDAELVDDLYWSLSEALARRTETPDVVMDRLSKRLSKRKGRIAPAEAGPGIAAMVVRINLLLGLAPDTMRAVVESEKGRAVLEKGLRSLGSHLVELLLK